MSVIQHIVVLVQALQDNIAINLVNGKSNLEKRNKYKFRFCVEERVGNVIKGINAVDIISLKNSRQCMLSNFKQINISILRKKTFVFCG